MLTIKNISKAFGENTLFENLNLFVPNRARSAIIGNNGSGKSTLLKIIIGEEKADSGSVFLENGKMIGYLPQNAEFESNFDLLHSVICINSDIASSLHRLLELKEKNYENNNSEAAEFIEANAVFEHYNGYKLLDKAKIILKILGFSENEFSFKTDFLSGGQKTRALLAKLLLSECDLLLLDEPTNHLDYEAQELFVNYLNNEFKGTTLIVSHDRYFLNQVADKIYELNNYNLTEYKGNYDNYLKLKKEEELTEINLIEKNKKIIAKMEESVQTLFSHRNFSARDSMVKKADRLKQITENYKKNTSKSMKLHFSSDVKSGRVPLKFENMSKSFDGKQLFDNVNLRIETGEKIGIIGPNGSGKSTFLKIINGTRQADEGSLTYGYNVKLAYFAQEFDEFNMKNTLFDELLSNTALSSSQTRDLLAKFLFTDEDIYKTVENLSGGEKCRLALAKIMAFRPNLLLLDEPTNHLDIKSREILEEAVRSYDGTVIIVSHDRYFLDRTTNITIEIKNGNFTKYYGNYSYFKEKNKNTESQKNSEKKQKEITDNKKRPLNNRQIKELLKPLVAKNKETEKQISLKEEKINELSILLGSEEIYKNGSAKEITEEYNKTETELNELFIKWEEIQNKISELNNQLK